jgi:hypothetical protein
MSIDEYCKNQKLNIFLQFSEQIKTLFYNTALFCVNNDLGNIKIANEVINHYKLNLLDVDQLRGVKSIVYGLKTIELHSTINKFPELIVYHGDNILYKIVFNYDKDLPNMFFVIQEYKLTGLDKELFLYFDDLKEQIINDIHKYNITITKIIYKHSNINKQVFYDINYGIIMNNNKCMECYEMFKNKNKNQKKSYLLKKYPDMKKMSVDKHIKECSILLNNGCLSKIRQPNKENIVYVKS